MEKFNVTDDSEVEGDLGMSPGGRKGSRRKNPPPKSTRGVFEKLSLQVAGGDGSDVIGHVPSPEIST